MNDVSLIGPGQWSQDVLPRRWRCGTIFSQLVNAKPNILLQTQSALVFS